MFKHSVCSLVTDITYHYTNIILSCIHEERQRRRGDVEMIIFDPVAIKQNKYHDVLHL